MTRSRGSYKRSRSCDAVGPTTAAAASSSGRTCGEELDITVDIRKRPRPAGTHWFVPLQPLWRVERTFAWLCRNRRLRHDYEATVTSSQTFVHLAAVAFMLNRLHATR